MLDFILHHSKLALTCCAFILSSLVLFGAIPFPRGDYDQVCRTVLVIVSLLCMTALIWRYIGYKEFTTTYRYYDSDPVEHSCIYHSDNDGDGSWRVSSN